MGSFHLVSLGCAKNMVDSELIIGSLQQAGWHFEEQVEQADLLLLNTCGFIQPAVEEGIEEILELVAVKKSNPVAKLVVVGCLVQRYQKTLMAELPEVDLFIGTEGCADIGTRVAELYDSGPTTPALYLPDRFLMDSSMPRTLTTPSFRGWFKITEGCDNHCSYCMIPSIRGHLRSRVIEDLVQEAQNLEAQGIRELSLIAQDITAYGTDLGDKINLELLLNTLISNTSIPWIRLLYLYPTGISDGLLDLIAQQDRLLPYLDIPFQHVSSKILKLMNRRYGSDELYRLVERIRTTVPDIAIRTTFLVGFPGETEADVEELLNFIQTGQFDHVGVFPYANEEGCGSENFPGQLSEQEKQDRVDQVLSAQSAISETLLKKYVGRTEPVLVEGLSRETDLLLEGRTRFQAPDVDGCVYINEGTASPGDIVKVQITESQVYDLVGGVLPGS